ncbi:MAG: glycerate kinase [Syntrophotaleaceae bacterium]
MKVVVALDSFKGSLTAMEACDLVARVLRSRYPRWQVVTRPMADGGEGTAAVLRAAAGGQWVRLPRVTGPLPGMVVPAGYAWLHQSRTAVVEMAAASGLALLPKSLRNPLLTTTFGTGELIADAMQRGAEEIYLALGGSATVDGGTGAALALGWRFLDRRGMAFFPRGGTLQRIRRILPPAKRFPRIEVLCDVSNPLCGPKGAARVFGPQKGATPAMVLQLETGLRHLADLMRRQTGKEMLQLPGGGAAGGFGAGAAVFFGGHLVSGVSAVVKATGLEAALEKADWVITGEGCFDEQSLHGKVVSGVRDAARSKGVKTALLAGRVKLPEKAWRAEGISFSEAAAGEDLDEERALAEAGSLLSKAAARLGSVLN